MGSISARIDPGKKYPALLYCQGGPQSAVPNVFRTDGIWQLMAANGYIVVAPNRRGLPTFGQEWNAQISGDYGGQNIKDYLSAIDEVKKEPYVDADVLVLLAQAMEVIRYCIWPVFMKNVLSVYFPLRDVQPRKPVGRTEEMFFVHHDLGGYYWDKPKPKATPSFHPICM